MLVGANTTISSGGGGEVTKVPEGGSINITCTSTGVPVPTITWTFDNMAAAPFDYTYSTTIFGATSESGNQVDFTLGHVVSTLLVENPQYPAHQGQYVCTGRSSYARHMFISSDFIALVVQGIR